MAVCYEIKFWILIFWLTQMICPGDVSTSRCWCQVLFMPSCPLGTRKSILYPQTVRGEEKHWSLILSWSTSFSAPWFIVWPGLKWAGNTNVYLGYPFCLCHLVDLIFSWHSLNHGRQALHKVENITSTKKFCVHVLIRLVNNLLRLWGGKQSLHMALLFFSPLNSSTYLTDWT